MATLEQAKTARAEGQKAVQAAHAEFAERMKGKPIPSQEECDLIKLGAPIPHKSGSGAAGPDLATRAMEGRPTAGYTTRAARPAGSSS